MILHYTQAETLVRDRRELFLREAEQARIAQALPARQSGAFTLMSKLVRRDLAASPRRRLASQAGC